MLLVDGVRVNSATAGTNALEHLPLAQIERIEVLHGPASGLYGADAIGGVIQVFTRQADGAQVRVGAGSQRTRSADASIGQQAGDTRWTLQGGWRETRGPLGDQPGQRLLAFNPDTDAYRNANVAASAWRTTGPPGTALTLRGTVSDSRTQFDGGPGPGDWTSTTSG